MVQFPTQQRVLKNIYHAHTRANCMITRSVCLIWTSTSLSRLYVLITEFLSVFNEQQLTSFRILALFLSNFSRQIPASSASSSEVASPTHSHALLSHQNRKYSACSLESIPITRKSKLSRCMSIRSNQFHILQKSFPIQFEWVWQEYTVIASRPIFWRKHSAR